MVEKNFKFEIRLFGAFRKFVPSGKIICEFKGSEMNAKITARQLKELVHAQLKHQICDFQNRDLIFESGVANSEKVLKDDDVVDSLSGLALLPPVCGG